MIGGAQGLTTGLLVALAGVALVGCSSSTNRSAPPSVTSAVTSTGASSKPPATSSPATTTATSPASTAPRPLAAQNLTVTPAVRSQLVQAGAAFNNLPASDYTGLRVGLTYYAFDPSTNTYWAGAELAPSATSLPAQVANQDNGDYLDFNRSASGTWTVQAVGQALISHECPTIPVTVLAAWGWAPGGCVPPLR